MTDTVPQRHFAFNFDPFLNTDSFHTCYDRLGNVIAITDDAGDLVCVYYTTAFGHWTPYSSNGFNQIIADPQPYHLTTKEYDYHIGLYYFNARWYNRHTGRYISSEPLGIDGPNLYHFNFNDPLNRLDASGLETKWVSWLREILDFSIGTMWNYPVNILSTSPLDRFQANYPHLGQLARNAEAFAIDMISRFAKGTTPWVDWGDEPCDSVCGDLAESIGNVALGMTACAAAYLGGAVLCGAAEFLPEGIVTIVSPKVVVQMANRTDLYHNWSSPTISEVLRFGLRVGARYERYITFSMLGVEGHHAGEYVVGIHPLLRGVIWVVNHHFFHE